MKTIDFVNLLNSTENNFNLDTENKNNGYPILLEKQRVSIKFEDEVMYNKILEIIFAKVDNYDNNSKTVEMTQENIDSVTTLELNNFNNSELDETDKIVSISGIEYFKNLTILNLNYNNIKNLSPISNLTNLEELNLEASNISNIDAIVGLENLITLNLSSNNIEDLSPMSNLTNLEELNLVASNISNIDAIAELEKLITLNLSYNTIEDLSPMSNLTNLENLNLVANNISNIDAIAELENLITLKLSSNNIEDLLPISNLISLKELNLVESNISNIDAIAGLENLIILRLSSNNIDDISPISNLSNLERLYLNDNNINDISPISNLTNLEGLYLNDNNITNIPELSYSKLKILDLKYNRITDISTLENLKDTTITVTGQKLILTGEAGSEIELYEIFKQAKDSNSIAYTEEDLILENCTLNENGTKVILNTDATGIARVKIPSGILKNSTLTINIVSAEHTYGDWQIIKQATCTEDGTKERICNECGKKETEVITKLGHNYESNLTPPTCTEKGYTTHTCTRCSDNYVDGYVNALGHNFGAWIIDKEASYEEEGHKYRVCTNCNTKEEETIPKLIKEELKVSTTYKVKEQDDDKFIIISIAKEVQEILNNITSNKELEVVDKDGNAIETVTKVGTGVKVIVKETKEEVYTVVVKGDANGDGEIDFINDIIRFNNYRLNLIDLDPASIIAGDIDEDEKIDFINDIIKINNYRLGIINTL